MVAVEMPLLSAPTAIIKCAFELLLQGVEACAGGLVEAGGLLRVDVKLRMVEGGCAFYE